MAGGAITSGAQAQEGGETARGLSAAQGGETAPGLSVVEGCEELTAWARQTKHDCAWAATLIQSAGELRGACNLTRITTELRQARLVHESCGVIPPEDMRSREVREDSPVFR